MRDRPPSRKRRLPARIAIVILAPVVFLALSELVLALAGVRIPKYYSLKAEPDYWIPYYGIDKTDKTGEPSGLQRVEARKYKYAPEKLPLFLKEKPQNGFRIFIFGESSVQGSPYEIGSFTDWIRIRLGAMMPARAVEAVNAGNAGWHAGEIRTLLQESLHYQPDLLVWMVGHNEFVTQNMIHIARHVRNPNLSKIQDFAKTLRTTQALSRWVPGLVQTSRVTLSDRMPKDGQPCVSDAELEYMKNRFRESVEGAIADAKNANVTIVLCTMPTNYTFEPSGSYFSERVRADPTLQKTWNDLYIQGVTALDAKDAEAASLKFEEALKMDGTPAKLRFRLGKTYEILGRTERARAELIKALELDAYPNRALPWIQQIIRDAAAKYNVVLTDLETVFNKAGALGLGGTELIYDNVHPTLQGHERIAEELLFTFERKLNIPLDRARDITGDAGRKALGLDQYNLKIAKRNEALMNFRLVLFSGDAADQWRRTRAMAGEALVTDPSDMEILGAIGLLETMRGETAAGKEMIEKAMGADSYVKLQYIFYYKTEAPYQRVFDKSGIDMTAAEKKLDDAEKKVLEHRLNRQKSR